MPDQFMVVSPEELAAGRVLPPEMVRDLRTVADVEIAAVDGLAQVLRQETGVLTAERLKSLTERFFDHDAAESVARTIQNLPAESKQKILELVDRWRQFSDERRESLPDAKFASLQRNLDSLVQDYPSLALMRKAQRLLRDTGNEILDSKFVCDLRPVFDEPRKRVEGFVALANLQFIYICQSGQRDVFEITFTENELSELIEKGQKALSKLEVLKETVHDLIQ